MKTLYRRWGIILLLTVIAVSLGIDRYVRDVKTLGPGEIHTAGGSETVRVEGRVEAGTLTMDENGTEAAFELADSDASIPVFYRGEATDTLRELKTLVVVGRWNTDPPRFEAVRLDLTPNYGFILAAYLVLIPLGAFLFLMEHRVLLLYTEIKDSKAYESEVQAFE